MHDVFFEEERDYLDRLAYSSQMETMACQGPPGQMAEDPAVETIGIGLGLGLGAENKG